MMPAPIPVLHHTHAGSVDDGESERGRGEP